MRSASILLIAAALGSCTTYAPEPVRPAASQQTIAWLLGGKVAQPTQNCVHGYSSMDMTVLDTQTIAFRDGGYRTYVAHLSPGCGQLASGGVLVTKSYGSSELCTGDIAQVMEGAGRMMIGSCSIGPITPYVRPR